MHAYIVVRPMAGVRPEEARAIGWEEDVDLDGNPPSVAVLRADRAGGDTKTPRSQRALKLAQMAVGALREWQVDQAAEREAAIAQQSRSMPAVQSVPAEGRTMTGPDHYRLAEELLPDRAYLQWPTSWHLQHHPVERGDDRDAGPAARGHDPVDLGSVRHGSWWNSTSVPTRHRRASPAAYSALETPVPWWGGRILRFRFPPR